MEDRTVGVTYEHWQANRLLRSVVGGLGLVLIGAPLFWGASMAVGASGVILLTTAVVFSGMGTEIERNSLRVWFGPGWIEKRISLDRIIDSKTVRNAWWTGWGIRYFGGGWLWTVSGFKAVELQLRDGTRFRIGSDDPEGLRQAIEANTPKDSVEPKGH